MKSLLQNLTVIGISLLGCALALEVFLRLVPGIITVADLVHFPSAGLRSELAAARSLPTGASVVRLERPDGGPEVVMPMESQRRPVDAADAEYGATGIEVRSGGFCNRKAPGEVAPELVAVGDSMVHCTSVTPEQSWVHLLGAMRNAEALNLGMPGQGLYEYRDALRTLVDTARLRTVIVAFAEGNDVRDGLQYLRHFEKHGAAGASPQPVAGESWLMRHSYLLNTLSAKFEVLGDLVDEILGKENFRYTVQTGSGPVMLNIANSDHNEIKYARRHLAGELSGGRIERVLDEPMRQIAAWAAAAENTQLLFVYLPSAHTAYGPLTSYENADIGELVRGFSAYQRALFSEICGRHGFDCLDLTARLNVRLATSPLAYFPANVHLTPEGNEIVAEEIARYLQGL